MCVCIHPNGSVRNEAKPVSSFQKSKKGCHKSRENHVPGTITQIVCVLRFEFSVGIERSQNLMLDQNLDQILIPYLFLVLSINFYMICMIFTGICFSDSFGFLKFHLVHNILHINMCHRSGSVECSQTKQSPYDPQHHT